MSKKFELKVSELRSVCDPSVFKFKNTSEVKPLDGVIGQERAVRAIEFGLDMASPGYNIFVTGVEGTGKSTIVRDLVHKYAKKRPAPPDLLLVNNFKDEFRPIALSIPPGKGMLFSKRLNRVVDILKKDLPQSLESETYLKQLSKIKEKFSVRQEKVFKKIGKFAAARNLHIDMSDQEFRTVPLIAGRPVTTEDYQGFSESQKADIAEKIRQVQTEIEIVSRKVDKLTQSLHADIEKLMNGTAMSVVKSCLDPLRKEFIECQNILDYLDQVQTDIIENFNIFIPEDSGGKQAENRWVQPPELAFQKYQVNVLVGRDSLRGAPVIFETNPTYSNIFGRIEKRAYMGTINSDFTMVQAGSLLQANGGYLVMEIEPLVTNPFVWEALKRALQTKSLRIEDVSEETGFGTTAMRPEPIPLEVKVILLGSYDIFEQLQNYDPKFNKIYKVRADFDQEVSKNSETIQQYAQFIARVCKEENLLPFNPAGVAAIVEFGEKYVSNQNKLSIRFGPLLGVLKEADYWARKNGARVVSNKYVYQAFNQHRFRYNLYEQKIHESYRDETVMIDVSGEVVGQVNALAVYQIGEVAFGRPVRITAETYMGKQGVINIEREANLSGSTHDKGVLIISGYLGNTFAQNFPLNLSISITFEQSYSGIDGDSASSTELYAILSSLAGIPIRQGIAVTGSVNQKGQVQAIGGENHKVEGYFEVCRDKGLTGRQGVIIPRANVQNLMLRREVLDAVKQKKFHVYQVSTVAEGIEILTGVPAGQPDQEGNFAPGTVYGEAQNKLKQYMQRFAKIKAERQWTS